MRRDLRKYVAYGVAPLVGTVVGGLMFKDFVVHAIQTNIALNGKILVTMAIGAALMYWRMWDMWREDKALRAFATLARASRALSKEQASHTLRELLESKRFARRDVAKVLEPVVQTGGRITSRVEQAAIEQEMHGMKEVLESRWEFPNFLVGFMVALGLLGTFIGLLDTLVGTSALIGNFGGDGNMDEAITKLVSGLREPLAGMGTAFSASMFGLVGSSVLGLIMLAVRSCGSALMGNVHATVNEFAERAVASGGSQHVSVSETYLANAMADLLDMQREAQETFGRAMQTTLSVTARSDGVLRKLEELSKAVAEQTEATRRSNDLIGVGPRMRELAEQALAENKAVVSTLLAQNASLDRVHRGLERLDGRLATQAEGAAREREVLRSAVATMTESENATRATIDTVREEERAERAAHFREMQALRQSTIDANAAMASWGTRLGHLQSLSADQLVLMERQSGAIERMSGAIEALTKQIAATGDQSQRDALAGRQAQVDVAKQLSGLGTVLRLNNEQVIENMTRLAENTAQHSAATGAVTQELRTLKAGLGRELRKELREALSQSALQDDARSR